MAKQSFEEWLTEQIQKVASGAGDVDLEFRPYLDMYLRLIESGMSIKAAKAAMNWYLEEKQLEGASVH